MARGKITKRSIDALIASSENDILWDDSIRGFGAKRTKSGTVSYVLQFRMGGRESKTRRYTIGSHGSPWTPTTARAEAERLSILVAQSIDPGEAERQRRREAVDLAFGNYADRFVDSCVGKGWKRLAGQALRLHARGPVSPNSPPSATSRCLRAWESSSLLPRRSAQSAIRARARCDPSLRKPVYEWASSCASDAATTQFSKRASRRADSAAATRAFTLSRTIA